MTQTTPTKQLFLVLGLHAIKRDPGCQEPKIDAETAKRELAADLRHAELRCLMEDPSYV